MSGLLRDFVTGTRINRTKVVVRHLPPTISHSNLVEQVDSRFSSLYRWLVFRPGKSSPKHLTYSRAYIDFNKPEDVIEFAEFFNGHVFVNEKGTQFKAIVEYAPSQRVPKQWSKKDGREGTILRDPEYLEFLEFLAKPVENLPSAEIQLERKEAERAGAPKNDPVVTPLMDYVRQRRAAKGVSRRAVLNGKPVRRVSNGPSSRNSVSGSSKRGLEKKRASTTMYVLRESSKTVNNNEKSTYLLVHKQQDQQLVDKPVSSGSEALEGGNGSAGSTGYGKKKILLLKGKEREISNISVDSPLQQNAASSAKASPSLAPPKQNQQHEASGRIIGSILFTRDTRRQSEFLSQTCNQDRDKKPPRHPSKQLFRKDPNGAPEDTKVVSNNLNVSPTEKHERGTRNKDRPDRGVWTPLRRSNASDESLSSAEGSYKQGGSRGSDYNVKDSDGPSVGEGKHSRRIGFHEKQVWVQKSSSGT